MKHVALNLETISPLAIRRDHAPTGTDTAQYIPGTTLAGSLASLHRLLNRENTEEFVSFFLSEKVQFPNLYPAQFKNEGMQNAQMLPVYPLAKTAQSCKRFPGFAYRFDDEDDTERHGVRDTLIDWTVFRMGSGENVVGSKLLKLMDSHKECIECSASMDHFTGYYRRDDREPKRIISAHVEEHTRLQTRTGINRETGTVQENILYNREVFKDGMHFWGVVKLADEVVEPFQKFIESATAATGLARIGTGRTRGMGKVSLGIRVVKEQQRSFNLFKERILTFHEALDRQAREIGLTNLCPFYFAITLHSPLITHDTQLRYRGTLNEEALRDALKMPSSMFTCEYQAADVQKIMGWNELWGTPRQQTYAIEMGSVFVFSCTHTPDDTLLQALFDLEEQGMGLHCAEGFGRIRLSDPFHLERGLL